MPLTQLRKCEISYVGMSIWEGLNSGLLFTHMPTFSRLWHFFYFILEIMYFCFQKQKLFSLALKLVLSVGLLPALFLTAAWTWVFVGSFYWPDPKLLVINMFCWDLGFILHIIHQELSFLLILSSFFGELPLTWLFVMDTGSNWLYVL